MHHPINHDLAFLSAEIYSFLSSPLRFPLNRFPQLLRDVQIMERRKNKNFFLLGQRTVPPAAPWSICIDTLFIMWARVCGEKSQVACQYLIRRQRRRLLRDFWSPSIRPRTRLWRIEGRVTKRRPPISMNMHIIAQVHIAGQHSKHCGPRSTSIFC